jgi:hypothetical protein
MTRIGAVAIAIGFAAVLLSVPFGAGPLGPTNRDSAMLLVGGTIVVVTGIVLCCLGMLLRLVSRLRAQKSVKP